MRFLDHVLGDLWYALRQLRKNPGFATLAVLVLGLGIGANTAVFTVANGVLFKPLAHHDPDRIVTLTSALPKKGLASPLVCLRDVVDWRADNRAFAPLAYYRKGQKAVLLDRAAYFAQVTRVSPDFFTVFGVAPTIGRIFHHDERWEANTAVVSYSFWQNRPGGTQDALSKTLRVDNRTFSIVGVLPREFSFPDETAVWFLSDTVNRETEEPRTTYAYLAVARLKDGISVEQAQSQMTAIAERLEQQYPDSNEDRRVVVARLKEQMTGDMRLTLLLLLGPSVSCC
jgi:putative ABC transport system permease protein